MDGQRFDALTRNLATTSRRRALGLLAGGALGGILAKVGLADAAAQETEAARRRRRDDRDDRDDRRDNGNVGDRCGSNDDCVRDLECCSGRCINTKTDERACGGCGKACGRNETCFNGGCFRSCRAARAGVCDTNACGPLCGCNNIFNGADGGGICESLRGSCAKARACSKNTDCPEGLVCVNDGCCPGKPQVCARPCGTVAVAATAAGPNEATRVPGR